jgi:hypothetical protein
MATTPDEPPEAQAQDATLAALTATRALIAQGWTQGASWRGSFFHGICHCLTGAVAVADTHASIMNFDFKKDRIPEFCSSLTILALSEQIADDGLFDHHFERLQEWNDADYRTQDDVLNLIDRAIAARQVAA